MTRKTIVKKHFRRTKRGKVLIRRHKRKVKKKKKKKNFGVSVSTKTRTGEWKRIELGSPKIRKKGGLDITDETDVYFPFKLRRRIIDRKGHGRSRIVGVIDDREKDYVEVLTPKNIIEVSPSILQEDDNRYRYITLDEEEDEVSVLSGLELGKLDISKEKIITDKSKPIKIEIEEMEDEDEEDNS